MKRRTLLAVVALLAAGVALGQTLSAALGARLKLRWQGDKVYLREGHSSHELSIRDQFQAVRLDTVILQSAKEANGFIYLLLDVTGPSKLPRDSHQCGGGNESNLVWLKLDKDWKLVEAKNFHYDSCWSSVSVTDPPKWQGDTLKVTTIDKVATYTYKRRRG